MGKHTRRLILLAVSMAALMAVVPTSGASAATGHRYCGHTANTPSIIAVGPTSCAFARRVIRRVERSVPIVELRRGMWGWAPRTLRVFSPVTGRSYRMRCRTIWTPESPPYVCTGGNGARVEVRS